MTIEERLEQATREGRAKQVAADAAHEARHGTDYVWVERRPGYRGRRVCRRCYEQTVDSQA